MSNSPMPPMMADCRVVMLRSVVWVIVIMVTVFFGLWNNFVQSCYLLTQGCHFYAVLLMILSITIIAMKSFKNCQSCGMPIKRDPQHGGTNKDSSKSNMYCSYCYQGGQFTQPEFTAQDMQVFCKGKLKEMGFPGFVAGFFTMNIPRLERWKK
jgi:hypothetical protein